MIVMSGVIITIAIKAWPVVERSHHQRIAREYAARDATGLGPAALVCRLGLVCADVDDWSTLAALSLAAKRRHAETESIVGAFAEQETLQ